MTPSFRSPDDRGFSRPDSYSEGDRLKAAALAVLEAKRGLLIGRARRAFVSHLLEFGCAKADDVRDAVQLPPEINPTLFGAVPGPLVKAGIIRAAGYIKTARRDGHARPITVWKLVNRGDAERWLEANPETPEQRPAASSHK